MSLYTSDVCWTNTSISNYETYFLQFIRKFITKDCLIKPRNCVTVYNFLEIISSHVNVNAYLFIASKNTLQKHINVYEEEIVLQMEWSLPILFDVDMSYNCLISCRYFLFAYNLHDIARVLNLILKTKKKQPWKFYFNSLLKFLLWW